MLPAPPLRYEIVRFERSSTRPAFQLLQAAGPVAIESASVKACSSLTDSIVFRELPTV